MSEVPDQDWEDGPPTGPYDALAAWERLRLVYNGLLLGLVLLFVLPQAPGWFREAPFWELLVLGAFAANVCYCVGPPVELLLVKLGARGASARGGLFVMGTLLALFLAFLALLTYAAPDR